MSVRGDMPASWWSRLAEVRAALVWIVGAWVHPPGAVAVWEQAVGRQELGPRPADNGGAPGATSRRQTARGTSAGGTS